jgi:hypothetical protein
VLELGRARTNAELEDDDDGEDGPDGVADDVAWLPDEDEQRDEGKRKSHLGREHGLPWVGPRERPELLDRGTRGAPPRRHRRRCALEQALLRSLAVAVGTRQAARRGQQRGRRHGSFVRRKSLERFRYRPVGRAGDWYLAVAPDGGLCLDALLFLVLGCVVCTVWMLSLNTSLTAMQQRRVHAATAEDATRSGFDYLRRPMSQ